MFLLTQCASPVLNYDRLSLLNLQDVSNKLLNRASPCLCRLLCYLPVRKHRRWCGIHRGLVVKLKLSLVLYLESQPPLGLCAEGLENNHFIQWRSLEPVHKWIIPLFLTAVAPPLPVFCFQRFYHEGVCTDHLHMLPRAKQPKESTSTWHSLKWYWSTPVLW